MNTTYFSEETVRRDVRGWNHDFAFAVHRRTGWQIGVLWKDPVIDEYTMFFEPSPAHTFCIVPDGRAIDVEGLHTLEEIKALYSTERDKARSHLRIEAFANEAAWVATAQENMMASILLPEQQRIDVVNKDIESSSAFLGLLKTLTTPLSPAPQPIKGYFVPHL